MNICKHFSIQDSRFKYICRSNAGAPAAGNTGLDKAMGSYIGFCDSDDYVNDMYEGMYRLPAETGTDIAVCSYRTRSAGQERADLSDIICALQKSCVRQGSRTLKNYERIKDETASHVTHELCELILNPTAKKH